MSLKDNITKMAEAKLIKLAEDPLASTLPPAPMGPDLSALEALTNPDLTNAISPLQLDQNPMYHNLYKMRHGYYPLSYNPDNQ